MPGMPFETFTRQRKTGLPYVTLQKKGVISLNGAAFEALGRPEQVELLYDRDAHQMALRRVDDSVEHAYKVRAPHENHQTWLISGGAFASYYEIDISASVRRPAHLDGDLLVVDLKHPGVEPRAESDESDVPESYESEPPESYESDSPVESDESF